MSEKIQLRRSSVSGRVPTTSQLDLGEIGINTHDGKVYIKKDDGSASIVEVGGGYDDLEDIIDDLPSVVSTTYLYNTSTAGTVASSSTVHLNSANWGSATVLYASVVNSKGKLVDAAAQEYLKPGAILIMQNMSSTSGQDYLRARITSAAFTNTTMTIGLTSVSTSGSTPGSLNNVTLGVVTDVNAYSLEQALGFDIDDANGAGAFSTDELSDNVTVKSVLETLGSKAKLLRQGLGVSVGDSNLGTFTGETIADNQTVKGALRNLEQAIENTANAPTALRFKFSTSVGAGPGTGKLRYDSTDTSLIDRIYIHEEDRDARDNKSFLDYLLKAGSYVYVTSRNEQATLLARLSSDATYTTNYYTLDLEAIQIAGSLPDADDDMTFGVLPGPAISGTGVPSLKNNTISAYSGNITAKAAGLVDGDVYRTSDGTLKVVYS